MKITKLDPFTGELNTIDIPLEGHEEAYEKWLHREGFIQNLLPHLTPDQREFLRTGITPESWEKAFGDAE